MTTAPHEDLAPTVNAILNAAKQDLGLTTDGSLALVLGVSPFSITKWRRGQLSPSSRALLPLLIQQHQIDVTKPRRRRKLVEAI